MKCESTQYTQTEQDTGKKRQSSTYFYNRRTDVVRTKRVTHFKMKEHTYSDREREGESEKDTRRIVIIYQFCIASHARTHYKLNENEKTEIFHSTASR